MMIWIGSLLLALAPASPWHDDYAQALQLAKARHLPMLVVFR